VEQIFRSKSLLRAMAVMALHPAEEFGVADLAALIGVARPSLLVGLQALEAAELITHRSVGSKKLYRVVDDHPLYPDIASIAIKTFGGQEVVLDALRADPAVSFAAIFGSFARGNPTSASDIDVLVVIDDDDADETDYRVAGALAMAGDRLGRVVHANIVRRSAVPGNDVVRDILSGPMIVLKGRVDG
jgi:predicted nucleotidyltransferase